MKRFHLLLSSLLIAIFGVSFAARSRHTLAAASAPSPIERTIEFSYRVHFPATANAKGSVHLWIPAPTRLDASQTAPTAMSIEGSAKHTPGQDPEYRDDFIVFDPPPDQVASGFDAGIRFTVTRKEYVALRNGIAVSKASYAAANAQMLQRYLQPDKLVPLNGVIAELAKEHTVGANTPLEKARQIYDYVVSTMHYDKSGEGWGRGDALWACDSKRGNCTDFHSVFIGAHPEFRRDLKSDSRCPKTGAKARFPVITAGQNSIFRELAGFRWMRRKPQRIQRKRTISSAP